MNLNKTRKVKIVEDFLTITLNGVGDIEPELHVESPGFHTAVSVYITHQGLHKAADTLKKWANKLEKEAVKQGYETD